MTSEPTMPEGTFDSASDTASDQVRAEIEVDLDAPIERVWSAVTDPEQLAAWLGDDVDLDVRPGGAGRVVDPDGSERGVVVTGVEPYERLTWHWWSDRHGVSTVEIELTPLPDATRLRVIERAGPSNGSGTTPGLPSASASASVPAAAACVHLELWWRGALAALFAVVCAGHRPALVR